MILSSEHDRRPIAITGASGQLGRELLRLIGKPSLGLCSKSFNLNNLDQIQESLYRIAPRVLINCAAWTRVDDAEKERDACFAINVHAVEALARICHEIDCLFVQISTDYVFGADPNRCTPYVESDIPGPLNIYGQSKLAGEAACRECTQHLIIRTCGLYSAVSSGPAFGRNFADTMLMLARDRDVIRVVNDQRCTPSYVPHVAEAIVRLIQSNALGTFHLTNSGCTTWHGFAAELIKQDYEKSKRQVAVLPIASEEYPSPVKRPHYSVLANEKLHQSLGITLPSWQEGLLDYIAAQKRFAQKQIQGLPAA